MGKDVIAEGVGSKTCPRDPMILICIPGTLSKKSSEMWKQLELTLYMVKEHRLLLDSKG